MKLFPLFFCLTCIVQGESLCCRVLASHSSLSSCVSTIQDALSSLSPAPSSVEVSIVTQTVTVRHPHNLSPSLIKSTIHGEGFDIVSTPASSTDGRSLSFFGNLSRLNPLLRGRQAKHVKQCNYCQAEGISDNVSGTSRVNVGVDSRPSPEQIASLPQEGSTATSISPRFGGPIHVTLSVGGMTCASCSNTITRSLVELPGVSEVAVNLLGNSATFTVDSQDRIQTATETIEDVGYEAEVISADPVESPAAPSLLEQTRYHLVLSVGGMSCASCSNTLTSVISGIPGVSDVVVHLLGKSASVTIADESLALQVVQGIEDAGFEADIVSLEKSISSDSSPAVGPRTVALRISGMFCPYVPPHLLWRCCSCTVAGIVRRKSCQL